MLIGDIDINPSDFTGYAVYTNLEETATFSCRRRCNFRLLRKKSRGVHLGRDADETVYHATVVEEVAKMAYLTETLGCVERLPQYVADKHYTRKHGKNAHYGQKKS